MASTECSVCRGPRDRPGQRYCRACHAAYMRAHRPAYRDLPPLERMKSCARAYSNVLLRRGHLEREACAACGTDHAQMHHPDYGRPRDVLWLCAPCHRALHRETADG